MIINLRICCEGKLWKGGVKAHWVNPSKENAAGVLAKELLSRSSAMRKLTETNKQRIDPIGWASQSVEKMKAKEESFP